jgi:hypothetical protein
MSTEQINPESLLAEHGLEATEVFSGDVSACPHCAAGGAALAA